MRVFFQILQSVWNSVLPSRLFALSGTIFLSSPSLQNSPFRSQLIWPFQPSRLGNTLCFGTVALLYTGGDYLLIVCLSAPLYVHILGAETLSVWLLFHQDQKRQGYLPWAAMGSQETFISWLLEWFCLLTFLPRYLLSWAMHMNGALPWNHSSQMVSFVILVRAFIQRVHKWIHSCTVGFSKRRREKKNKNKKQPNLELVVLPSLS